MNIYIPYTYIIKFLPTGQVYYGVSYANSNKVANPSQLWTSYFTSSKIIHGLIKEHGIEAFTFEVRKTFDSKEKAVLWEHKILIKFDAKNNPIWLNQNNGNKKFKAIPHTTETKLKISLAHKGKKLSPITVEKIKNANTGKKRTPEQNANTSARQLGTKRGPLSDECKKKLSSILKDRKLTSDHKQKISIALTGKTGTFTGRNHTPETKAKISAAHLGKKKTRDPNKNPPKGESHPLYGRTVPAEIRQKISMAHKGKPKTEKQIQSVIDHSAKTYSLTTPAGDTIIITNMAKFCRDNDLLRESMMKVIHGRMKSCNGWTGKLVE
jgi:hypothetical protein